MLKLRMSKSEKLRRMHGPIYLSIVARRIGSTEQQTLNLLRVLNCLENLGAVRNGKVITFPERKVHGK